MQHLITPAYAAIAALVFLGLSIRTIKLRRALGIGLGDGNERTLSKAIRAHANFVEYVPLTLLLCFFWETLTSNANALIHLCCAILLVGRILHAYGISQVKENFNYRIVGMVFTFTAIFIASIGVLYTSVFR